MLRPLAAVLAALTLLPTAAPAVAATPSPRAGLSVIGRWQGKVKDDSGALAPYQVTVHISRASSGDLKGKVHYPHCVGTWTYVRTNAGWKVFTEKIIKDPGLQTCVPRLKAKVKRTQSGGLYVKWVYHQRTDHMMAHRI